MRCSAPRWVGVGECMHVIGILLVASIEPYITASVLEIDPALHKVHKLIKAEGVLGSERS